MHIHRAIAVISNAKQNMSDRENGPVKTKLIGPASRALYAV